MITNNNTLLLVIKLLVIKILLPTIKLVLQLPRIDAVHEALPDDVAGRQLTTCSFDTITTAVNAIVTAPHSRTPIPQPHPQSHPDTPPAARLIAVGKLASAGCVPRVIASTWPDSVTGFRAGVSRVIPALKPPAAARLSLIIPTRVADYRAPRRERCWA